MKIYKKIIKFKNKYDISGNLIFSLFLNLEGNQKGRNICDSLYRADVLKQESNARLFFNNAVFDLHNQSDGHNRLINFLKIYQSSILNIQFFYKEAINLLSKQEVKNKTIIGDSIIELSKKYNIANSPIVVLFLMKLFGDSWADGVIKGNGKDLDGDSYNVVSDIRYLTLIMNYIERAKAFKHSGKIFFTFDKSLSKCFSRIKICYIFKKSRVDIIDDSVNDTYIFRRPFDIGIELNRIKNPNEGEIKKDIEASKAFNIYMNSRLFGT